MSDMIEDLRKQNISLRSYQPGNHKTTCPRCSHTRKNKKDPCLSVTIEDGGHALWNCHNCAWRGGAGNVTSRREDRAPKEYKRPEPVKSPAALPDHVMAFLTKRGITPEVAARNRLYWNAERGAICFPYYQAGELVNVKYRTLDKKFSMEAGARLVLYGMDDVLWMTKPGAEGDKTVIIVEGEFDKLALEVAGLTNVVSVPNGAPGKISNDAPENTGKFEYLATAEALFKSADKVILATDDDEPGYNLRFELARRIGLHKCWVAKFPCKDANDCLVKYGVDIVLDSINDARPWPIKGLYQVDDFMTSLDDFFNNRMRAGSPTGWENLDRLYTVMDGELTVITGVPNNGKSEFLNALMINQAKSDSKKFVIFSPEDSKEQLTTKLIEKIIELPTNPKAGNRMTIEQFHSGAEWVREHFYFIVNDDDADLPTVDWILEKARAAVYHFGVKGLVIDPYNELEHQRDKHINETEYVSLLLSKLKRFAKSHMVHIWLVAHPAKLQSDKDGKTRIPTLYDIAGSANFVNKPDNGLVIHRSEDASSTTEIYVRKIRQKHVGRLGKCALIYDKDTGKYRPSPDEVYGQSNKSFKEQDMETHEAY